MWKERLRKDPSYTKQVLSSADVASQIIIQRIDILKKGGSQDIDLRSSTPVEVDLTVTALLKAKKTLPQTKNKAPTKARSKVTKFLGKRRDICTDKEIPRYFHKQRGLTFNFTFMKNSIYCYRKTYSMQA